MVDVLQSCCLRFERADAHLGTLDKEIRVFSDAVRNGIEGRFEPRTGEYIMRASGKVPDWGLVVGEFAHQMRAILDNLIWSLVEDVRGGTGGLKTGFVIADKKSEWDSRRGSRLNGLFKSDKTLIKKLQPYYRANGVVEVARTFGLSKLAWLNNRDKHRLLHPTAVAAMAVPRFEDRGAGAPIYPPVPANHTTIVGSAMAIEPCEITEEGADFCWVSLADPGPDPQMKMDSSLPISVTLTDLERPLSLDDLRLIRHEVDDVFSVLKPLFIP